MTIQLPILIVGITADKGRCSLDLGNRSVGEAT